MEATTEDEDIKQWSILNMALTARAREEIRSDKAGLKSRLSKYDTNSDLQNKLRALEHEEIELEKAFLANI